MAAIKSGAIDQAEQLRPVIDEMRANGVISLGGLAAALNDAGIVAARGGGWHASSVRNLLARLNS